MTTPSPPDGKNELLIVSVTPQNLERGALWFKENFSSIKRVRATTSWWRDQSIILEKDLTLAPATLIRQLTAWAYERIHTVRGRGLFAVRGGIIEVWPINTEIPYLIEFRGNIIESIHEREAAEERIAPKISPSRTHAIEKLAPGSFIVHVDHGIGIFRGYTAENQARNSNFEIQNKFEIQNQKYQNSFGFPLRLDRGSDFGFSTTKNSSEFFVVEYAPPAPGRTPDYLYVPTDQKDRLAPYLGFETPRIWRLGGSAWHTTKRKVKEETEKLAKELLALYATRHVTQRPPHEGDETLEGALRATFPFQETADQLRAEHEILQDLARPQPMDRVLAGDVGFGKTELALRAALRVIASGKQVAFLAPTTVLAAQHEKTFHQRLGDQLPIRAAMLSRLTPPQEQKSIITSLAEGKIDCIIGTHRLLSRDIRFKDLGLVVIDEEQRFGVKQKERFKELRAAVDMLSLSATPIPRTMHLALARLRDISRLETPPPERLPIVTSVLPYSKKLIREAIATELTRKGQVYFLHNRIETLGLVKRQLEKLTAKLPSLSFPYDRSNLTLTPPSPCAAIGIIHGRMKEKELIRVMDDFREKKIHILIATTIIENGLDISSANTLIVDDATRLGLAEAHQLRGRIGRGNMQAFAYFLYRPRHLTEKAAARLAALQEYADLGAGYDLALRDLEIRGAGNILGREQSGAINKVGLNLYYQMLAEAVEETKTRLTEKPQRDNAAAAK